MRDARTPEMKDRVLTRFKAASSTSTREVASKMDISQPVVWPIVHEECMHQYHVQRVQSLHIEDYPHRADFSQWMLGIKNNNPSFPTS
ncbi:hypothetical protein TNCT_382091 [Trichonephila clavata]|uniref:Transposase n=1 Tax=Trichonephila clavata TaxID=2740835 RepID=A0A8X6LDX6_TRICU|nr:hypothetical protein TNCT_382091 [Trichonephila clavata]